MRRDGRSSLILATLTFAALGGLLSGAGFGCADAEPFTCADDRACDLDPEGRCEADAHCSYPDTTCPLGRRYRDGDGGDECIGGEATGTDSDADSDSGTDSDTTSGSDTDSGTDSGTTSGTTSDSGTISDSDTGSASASGA